MRLTVLGSGAMACLFGARLAPLAEVTLLGAWREGIEAIAARGITLETPASTQTVRMRATTDPHEAGPADFVLVLVKAWQTGRAAAQAAQVLAPGGIALTLQNGLGNIEKLRATVGPDRASLGVTTLGVTLLGPGSVREGGCGPIHLVEHPALEPLVQVLRAGGFTVTQSPLSNLQSLAWGKVVVNCGINALTALLRVPNGRLLDLPDARILMGQAASEAAKVAQAAGVQLPFSDPALEAASVARATAGNQSSMLQDVLRGAPTEIDAINGAVVNEAQRYGLAAPVNEALWHLIRGLAETGSKVTM